MSEKKVEQAKISKLNELAEILTKEVKATLDLGMFRTSANLAEALGFVGFALEKVKDGKSL